MRPVYSKDPRTERSLGHAVKDGVAFSVMTGGGESYFSAFALFFKATTVDVGILSTLPMLVGSFTQLLSVLLGRRHLSRRTLMLTGAITQTLIWIPLVFLPFLFPEHALPVLLGCLIAYYAAGSLVTPQWTSLMGDLVPERKRGRYFGRRSRLASVTNFAALACAGMALHAFAESGFPTSGFFVIFGVAALARAASAYHIGHLHDPGQDPWSGSSARPFARRTFVRFSLFYGLMQFGVGIGGPFFAVYMLRDLQLSYLVYMTLLAASVLAQFLTLNAWGRISDTWGSRRVLRVTGVLMPLIPIAWLFGSDFTYLLAVQAFSGAVWAGFTLAAGNTAYDLLPPERRAVGIAGHNIGTNIGLFAGALVGAWLGQAEWVPAPGGLLTVFLVSGLVRLAVALVFLPRMVDTENDRQVTFARLLFRATGSRRLLRLLRQRRPSRPQPVPETAPLSTATHTLPLA